MFYRSYRHTIIYGHYFFNMRKRQFTNQNTLNLIFYVDLACYSFYLNYIIYVLFFFFLLDFLLFIISVINADRAGHNGAVNQ